jgi:hypothetical protein
MREEMNHMVRNRVDLPNLRAKYVLFFALGLKVADNHSYFLAVNVPESAIPTTPAP